MKKRRVRRRAEFLMFRDLLSSRLIQGGLAFFVLVVGGSLLYSWHVHRTTEVFYVRPTPQTEVSPLEKMPTPHTAPVDFQTEGVTNTPDETTDTHRSEVSEGLPNATDDIADAFLPDNFVSEEEPPAAAVPVSPFGFGPYPEVPADYPGTVMWHWGEEKRQKFAGRLKDMELIHRVLIKLWNQGDREWLGAKRDDRNGRVYPLYCNRIYINSWHEVPVKGGKLMRFPGGGFSATPDWNPATYLQKFYESGGQLPDHIQFIDKDAAGYDPLTFLNLK